MLGARRVVGSRHFFRIRSNVAALSSSAALRLGHSNTPLNLDPAMTALLKDAEISFKTYRSNSPLDHRELEVVPGKTPEITRELAVEEWSPLELPNANEVQPEVEENDAHRKSPAARFGSQNIGAVVLPLELQSAINSIISESDRSQLHSDARRLFQTPDAENELEPSWDIQKEHKYHSRKQAAKHATRDGTAFISVALPAHLAAIQAVLHHLKQRLDPGWSVNHVMDWGAGTGSGLWASLYTFQTNPPDGPEEPIDQTVSNSSVASYLGIDKRDGLVAIGKRLVSRMSSKTCHIDWKRSFRAEDNVGRENGHATLALSAFMLSSLPNSVAQKNMVKEMWSSGAHTIVLIDHNTKAGFEAIAYAREYLLNMGRLELEDPEADSWPTRGSHVLAPCPHDRVCPLLEAADSLVCGFSQRIQRPSFVRLTKHSGVGHEDIEYSYVIIRRGPRPNAVKTGVGRVGVVGKRAMEMEINSQVKELEEFVEGGSQHSQSSPLPSTSFAWVSDDEAMMSAIELQAQLRSEAYQWPRLVFPPLKKSGHVILDTCSSEGKIMRMTIPKSQGKQPFYDARKANWGDLFPHAPKNPPLERHQPKTRKKGQAPVTGGDIGKRRDSYKNRERLDYAVMADGLREKKKLSKRDYARTRVDKGWED